MFVSAGAVGGGTPAAVGGIGRVVSGAGGGGERLQSPCCCGCKPCWCLATPWHEWPTQRLSLHRSMVLEAVAVADCHKSCAVDGSLTQNNACCLEDVVFLCMASLTALL